GLRPSPLLGSLPYPTLFRSSYCVRYMIVNAPELSGGAEHLRVSAFGKRYINGCVILPGSRCKVGDINGARPVCDRLFAQRSNSTDRKSTRLNSSHVKISYAV